MMSAADLIGIPYRDHGRDRSGLDCWGLVMMASRELFGRELPDYGAEYRNAEDLHEVGALIERQWKAAAWAAVPPGEETAGDVIVLVMSGAPWHTGIIIEPGSFLHVLRACFVSVGSYGLGTLWHRKAAGIFRRR